MAGRFRLFSLYAWKNSSALCSASCKGSPSFAPHFSVAFSTNVHGVNQSPLESTTGANEEVRSRCAEFIRRCKESNGSGSVDLLFGPQGIAEIKLNNPKKKNAFSGPMFLDLERVVTQLESWKDGKAVILYGEKDAFCSGGDLEFVQQIATPELGLQMSIFMQNALHRLQNLPLIVVAMIRGPAHGGGAELTTACDFRVFTRGAEVRFVQAKLGITTGWGGATRLARIIGSTAALQILCSTTSISQTNCRQLGYCELICKDSEGVEITKAWLTDTFLRASVDVIRNYKKLTRATLAMPLLSSYELETEFFQSTWGSEQHIQAVLDVTASKKNFS